ncbi:MAG TPA: hypothetical protein GXX40_08505 [Firmicutes bacterium]|nr:hypothetical protein [Bacillota bacterium]
MNGNPTAERVVFENFLSRLRRLQDSRVNVEFFCGNCCKKAIGGTLSKIGTNFIELTAHHELQIEVITFFNETTFSQFVDGIVIPITQVCSVELIEEEEENNHTK